MSAICREFAAENQLDIEIAEYRDGDSFLNSKKDHSIVFMDIYMEGMDGILTARELRKRGNNCLLIFTTSSGEHMPDAFSCHAFEYIVKPFSPQRVKKVLGDALRVIPSETEYTELYSDRKKFRVALENIVSAITDAHYLDVALADGTSIRCRMTTGQFLEQVGSDERFILVNKGIIVNADYVVNFDNSCCILENGTGLPIRVRDRLSIEQTVREYNFNKIRKKQRYGG